MVKNNGIMGKLLSRGSINLSTPFKKAGTKWEIHKLDPDINNPSCPHMHAIGKPWKLDLYTGKYYDTRNGKYIGKIRLKDLIEIWKVEPIYNIITAERERYNKMRKMSPLRLKELPLPLVENHKSAKRFNNHMTRSIGVKNKSNSIIVQVPRRNQMISRAKTK